MKSLIHKNYSKFIETSENNLVKNPKMFWYYVKFRNKSHTNYPTTMHFNGKISSSAEEIAIRFTKYFLSVFQHDTFINENIFYKQSSNDINFAESSIKL